MKKADIISRMAEGAGITKDQAEKAMNELLDAVKDGLQDGGNSNFKIFSLDPYNVFVITTKTFMKTLHYFNQSDFIESHCNVF
jgi:hypothetical protein